jgi:hypothetical protein
VKDAQKPDHISLNTLIGRIKEGRFMVPDFQREFEWNPWDISALMRSIFLDYYIGSLLLWKGKKENFEALSCESLYGFEGKGSPEYIVLDGQQRLTALHYAFLAPERPLPNRANRAIYFVHVDKFMAQEYDQAFSYDWNSRRIQKLMGDRNAQFAAHFFPMSMIGEGGRKLYKWFEEYEDYWKEKAVVADAAGDVGAADIARNHAKNAEEFAEYTADLFEKYQISYIQLDEDLAVDKVCDIFTQINSRGIRLDIFDLLNALLKPKGLQLKHMWRAASDRLEFVESEKMNVYILQVMSIMRQAYCSPRYLYFLIPGSEKPIRDPDGSRRKEILVPDIADFDRRWNRAVEALAAAIKILRHPQEFGAISAKYLPYVSILPAFASLQAFAKTCEPGTQLTAQRKIRHWYWASVFMNRYSGSVESTSARDYLDIKAWIEEDAAQPSLIQDFKHRFRGLELRKETKRGSSVYNGVFNLLVIQGARDWITGQVPQHDDLDDHHIVPASWGSKNLPGNSVHTILNRTPLSGGTNRKVIADRLPNEYLPEWIATNGENTVRAILESHFISPAAFDILMRKPFTPDDFEAFISERQRTLQDAIENLLVKERLDLPPNLRQLDAEIEQAELAIRAKIVAEMAGERGSIPEHVQQKIKERLQRDAKKNPAMDLDYYERLAGKLEYADLRELQDIILAKANWEMFQGCFASKELLMAKFSQLAELRNRIRHSRAVDQVFLKEGEAALIWFKQVLGQ